MTGKPVIMLSITKLLLGKFTLLLMEKILQGDKLECKDTGVLKIVMEIL